PPILSRPFRRIRAIRVKILRSYYEDVIMGLHWMPGLGWLYICGKLLHGLESIEVRSKSRRGILSHGYMTGKIRSAHIRSPWTGMTIYREDIKANLQGGKMPQTPRP